jgi:hypothetical protein
MLAECKTCTMRAMRIPIDWHSGLSIYASESFLKNVSNEYGWIGGTNDSGKLRCVLPYVVIRKAIFHMIRFQTQTISLGEDITVEEEKSFLNSVVKYFRSSGADIIIPATNSTIFRTYPDGAIAAPYGTFIKDLNQPEDVLMSEISKDYRKKIRRAVEQGVQINSGIEYLDIVYKLIIDTLDRSLQKFKFSCYDDFKRFVLGFGDNVRIFVAKCGGVAQACLVTPFSEYSAYTLYGGTISMPVKGAMHLLHWEAIRQFHLLGVNYFNFTGVRINPKQGSKQEGIMTFKMRFGGGLVQGYMWKYSLRPVKSLAYSVAVRLLRHGDIVDLERHKLDNV